MVRALLRAGAVVDHANACGETALHIAAWWGNEAAVRAMLAKGATFSKVDILGQTALFYAKQHGCAAVVQAIEEAAVEVKLTDESGGDGGGGSGCGGRGGGSSGGGGRGGGSSGGGWRRGRQRQRWQRISAGGVCNAAPAPAAVPGRPGRPQEGPSCRDSGGGSGAGPDGAAGGPHAHGGGGGAAQSHGEAVQVDPIKPMLEGTGTERLKLKCDGNIFKVCFQIQVAPLHHGRCRAGAAAAGAFGGHQDDGSFPRALKGRLTRYPISIWSSPISILSSPISLDHIPYRYPG